MAETLGMLCNKLTIVKIKQYHTTDEIRLKSPDEQCKQLQVEIDTYFADAIFRKIDPTNLTFASNMVFKQEGNEVKEIEGKIEEVFYQLADLNCRLWHEQEKVYEFEKVPSDEKDKVVKQLALLNLERNKCNDAINSQFAVLVLNEIKN